MYSQVTYIRQDHYKHWYAITEIDLGDNLQLSIRTSKTSSGLLNTNASVGRLEGGFVSHVVYQDYSKSIKRSTPARCTSKVVEAQHMDVLKDIDAIKDAIALQYSKEAV